MLAQRLGAFSFPLLRNSGQNSNFHGLKRKTSTIQKYALLFVLAFALIILFLAPTITHLLFGEAFVQGSIALQILALGVIFLAPAQINLAVLNGIGKPASVTQCYIVAALSNLVGTLMAIPF